MSGPSAVTGGGSATVAATALATAFGTAAAATGLVDAAADAELTKRLLGNPGSGFVRREAAVRGGRTKPRLTSKPKPEPKPEPEPEPEVEAEVEAGAEAEGAPEVAFCWAVVSFLSSRVT